ncbi:MAG TPA: 7TM diverse intracellular signaling domain-containing protein, partial [Cytophagales bacterium]|nr:7TM diverse intracellular signaling domain-containing protein [Cytophagales bacterium]
CLIYDHAHMRTVSLRAIYLFIFFSYVVLGQVVLKDDVDIIKLTHRPYDAFDDPSNKITIDQILKNQVAMKRQQDASPYNKKLNVAYWLKFTILDSSSYHTNWFIELYNYRIDSVDMYIVDDGRIIYHKTAGDQYIFAHKPIRHKNFSFEIPSIKNRQLDVYYRFKSKGKADFATVIKRSDYFVSYATDEYFYLGLFYGMLLLVVVCNLMAYTFTSDLTHVFYFGYALCFTIYSAAQDGLGFQYLWPQHPQINNHIPAFALCLFIINQLLFSVSFHKVFTLKSIFLRIALILSLCRVIYLIVGLYFLPTILVYLAPDMLYSFCMLAMGIHFFKKGNRPSAFFIVGVVCFITGYCITSLAELMLLPHNVFTIYAINIGAVVEMLAFFISVGENSSKVVFEKVRAENYLKLNEVRLQFMEDTQNTLAQKVKEATAEITRKNELIEMKNKELETFIYKSAHNLLGPVRNIKGLTYLSNSLIETSELPSMMRMIHKANTQLENEILAMNKMSTILMYELNIEKIDLIYFLQKFFSQYHLTTTTYEMAMHIDKKLFIEFFECLEATLRKVTKSDKRDLYLEKNEAELTLKISFEAIDDHLKYLTDEFFLPLHRDLSYLFGIEMEPYILKCIAEKLNGTAQLMWDDNHAGQFIITIKDFNSYAPTEAAAPLGT